MDGQTTTGTGRDARPAGRAHEAGAPRRAAGRLVGLLALLTVGCGGLNAKLPTAPRVDPAAYPEEGAVLLTHTETVLLERTVPRDKGTTTVRIDLVIQILRESGLKHADYTFDVHAKSELVDFKAQTVAPDGTVTPVARDKLLVDTHRNRDEERRRYYKVQFPNATVGSLLQLSAVVQHDYARYSHWGSLTHPLAAVHSEVVVEGDWFIWPRFDTYNAEQPVPQEDLGSTWRYRWVRRDVPRRDAAHDTRHYGPHYSWYEPWYVYRAFAMNRGQWPGYKTWDDAASGIVGDIAYGEDGAYDGPPLADRAGCADVTCVVARALTAVRTRAPWKGWGRPGAVRNIDKVLESGEASSSEQSMLLWRTLTQLGVKAQLALMSRKHTILVDPKKPLPGGFYHLLVNVPRQEGLDRSLWVDPSCRWCGPGQIPQWVSGLIAYVATAKKDVGARFADVTVGGKPIRGEVAGPDGETYAITGTLTADGALAGHWLESRQNLRAHWFETNQRRSSAEKKAGWLRETARSFFGEDATWNTVEEGCDWDAARCTRKVDFEAPAFAVVSGARIVVPLKVLSGDNWDDDFKRQSRTLPVVIRNDETVRFSAAITLPDGWTVAEHPPAFEHDKGPFRSGFSVSEKGGVLHLERWQSRESGRYYPPQYPDQVRAPARAFAEVVDAVVTLERAAD